MRIWLDWGNTPGADTDELGSIQLKNVVLDIIGALQEDCLHKHMHTCT